MAPMRTETEEEGKLYRSISEVSEMLRVKPHVLRYWETQFGMLRPRKNHAGQRVYRRADIELVLRIKRLLYEDRLTLEGAKKRLLQDARGRSQQLELPAPDAHTLEILRGIRAHLEGMRRILRGQAASGPLERRRRST